MMARPVYDHGDHVGSCQEPQFLAELLSIGMGSARNCRWLPLTAGSVRLPDAAVAERTVRPMGMDTYTIEPNGPFSLEEAATFGFGQRHDTDFDGTMRLAFCVDGYTAQAGVALTQTADGKVRVSIEGMVADPDPKAIIGQVARVLSIDQDATGFVALGERDPVMARLLAVAPGLRPRGRSGPGRDARHGRSQTIG